MTKQVKIGRRHNTVPSFSWKRIFIFIWISLLLTPAITHFFFFKNGSANTENRVLAEMPAMPHSAEDTLKLAPKVDAYLNDHFGFRKNMIDWNNAARYHVFGDINSVQLTAGKDGYLFFNSHSADDPLSMIHYLCGRRTKPHDNENTAGTASQFMHLALDNFPNSYFLVVPTKSAVYADKLPDWIQRQCAGFASPVAEVVEMLNQDTGLRGKLIYPIEEMKAMKSQHEIYTKYTLHWEGDGASPIAKLIASNYFQMASMAAIATSPKISPADMQRFLPGVALNNVLNEPNYQQADIKACLGGQCFPELIHFSDKIGDVSRYTQLKKKGPKLLIISDSFGQGIAGLFSEYFGEVWHISLNNLNALSEEDLVSLKEISLKKYEPDHVLYVFHDFSLAYFDRSAKIYLKATKQ